MLRHNISQKTGSIKTNSRTEGETIEQKIERIVSTNAPITDGAPIIYLERKEGIKPEYDVRTDRFEIAIDAMNVVHKTKLAKREERQSQSDKAEPTQGTNNGNEPAA